MPIIRYRDVDGSWVAVGSTGSGSATTWWFGVGDPESDPVSGVLVNEGLYPPATRPPAEGDSYMDVDTGNVWVMSGFERRIPGFPTFTSMV